MWQSRRSRFGDLIHVTGSGGRRRFLTDLWTAHGWKTTVERSVVIAHHGDRTERLAVASRSRLRPSPTTPAEAAVVVALGDPERTRHATPGDARVLSVDEFHGLIRYGLPADRGGDLVADHFGVRLDDLPADDRDINARGASEAGDTVVSPLFRQLSSLPVTPLVFIAFLLAAVIMTAGPDGVPALGKTLGGRGSSIPAPAATTPEPMPTPEPRTVAPGVTAASVENVTRLAAAHRRTAANRSYRWTLSYRESVAGNETGREVGVIRVEAPHVYISEVRRIGRPQASPRPTALEDSHADGVTRCARRPARPDGVTARALDPDMRDDPGRRASHTVRYLDWYLSTDETGVTRVESVTNETTESGIVLYQVRGLGTDFPRSHDYRVEAVIGESGFIRSMHIAYETHDGLGVRVWFAYNAVDGVTTTRPA